jgi:hypothetical protein
MVSTYVGLKTVTGSSAIDSKDRAIKAAILFYR